MGPWWLLALGLARGAPDVGACPGCRVDESDGWRLSGGQIVGPDGTSLRFEGDPDASGLLTIEDMNAERDRLAAELDARGLKMSDGGGRVVTTVLGEPTVVVEGTVTKTRKFDKLSPGQTAPRSVARITRRCSGTVRVSAEGDTVDLASLTRAAGQVLWADPACERYNAHPYHQVSAVSVATADAAPPLDAPPPPPPESPPVWPWIVGALGIGGVGLAVGWSRRPVPVSSKASQTRTDAAPKAPFRPRESAAPPPEIQSIGWGAGPVFKPDAPAPAAPPLVSPPVLAPVPAVPPTAPPPAAADEEPMLVLRPIPFAAAPRASTFGFAATSPAPPPDPEPPMEPMGPVFSPKPLASSGDGANADPMAAAIAALGQQLGLDRAPPSAGQATRVPAPYAAFLESCDGASWGGGWLRLLGARDGRGLTVQALNAGLAGRIGRRFALGYFGDGSLVALSPRGEVVVGFPDGRPTRGVGSNLTAFLVALGKDAALRESLCDPAAIIRVQRVLGPLGPDQVFDWSVDPPRKAFILARWEGASLL